MQPAAELPSFEKKTPATGIPSRARFVVLVYLCSLAFILYLDRICISQAVKPIQDELQLTNRQMSYVLMAFTLAYGMFEIPTGYWGDRIGPRRVLTRIVLWWSAFTALTGLCTGLYSLVVIRFFFGAGEAGAYPNVARVVSRWFPMSERGRTQGLLLAASQVGGSVAPALAAFLIDRAGWRLPFLVFGSVGIVWAGAFLIWFRDSPANHPAVNEAELSLIQQAHQRSAPEHVKSHRIPWRRALSNRSLQFLGLNIICSAFTSYVYFSWYQKYLMDGRGVDMLTAGWLGSLVLGCGAVGILGGGFLADWLSRPQDLCRRPRIIQGFIANAIAAALLYSASTVDNPYLSASLTGLSFLCMQSQQPIWWSSVIETSGRHVGALFGMMNMVGAIGAMGSQYFFGAFTDWRADRGFTGRAQWDPAFVVCAGLLALGATCWLFVDLRKHVEDESAEGQANAC